MTTGDELIEFADQLVRAEDFSPAASRAAISRAYYGAYHVTAGFLRSLGINPGKEHNLHRDLQNSGQPAAQRAGSILDDLYARRRVADYELDRENVEKLKYAQLTMLSVRDFQSELRSCHQEPARSAVKAGIEAYRKRISPRGSV